MIVYEATVAGFVQDVLDDTITDNVYEKYKEHHLLRWLGLTNKLDPLPNVVVGSDDTGIFATNIQNEYLHIYQALRNKLSKKEAIEKIKYLNSTSKAYTFK